MEMKANDLTIISESVAYSNESFIHCSLSVSVSASDILFLYPLKIRMNIKQVICQTIKYSEWESQTHSNYNLRNHMLNH